MQFKQPGNTDLRVSPICFGGNVFGWTINEQQSFTILDAFTDAGFNFIDTADVYSRWVPANHGGESERIIGKWMKEKRNRKDIVLATKVGSDMDGSGKKDTSKAYILRAVDDSLRRLQTDYIDLYQTHYDDMTTPVQETLEAYDELVRAGKVRWIGTSNMEPARIEESLRVSAADSLPRYETLQPHYNLYAREHYEKTYEALAREHHLGVIPYYSLESGFLTGKYRSEADLGKSARGGGMKSHFTERGFRILDALDTVANETGTTPAAVALAWLLSRDTITAPIVSATSVKQLESMTSAAKLQLSADAIMILDQASAYQRLS